MRVKLRTLFIVWAVLVSLTLWAFVDSLSAGITRPVIHQSELKWSSYHAYHCMLYSGGDTATFSYSRINKTLKACKANKRWAKRTVKKLHLMRYPVKKRVKRIFNYVFENWDYDENAEWLETAIRTGTANCSAYADLFYVLCKASKIPVRYVIGWTDDGTVKGWHCWNRVKIKNKWHWIDCTWGLTPRRKLWKSHSRICETW